MSSSGEQKRRPGAPDDTDGKRRLRTVNTYPDPYLVTKLPIEAKVSSGVIRVGEKTILGFIHRPFPDGTPVRVVYDEWLFAERIDEPPPAEESAEEAEDSTSGSAETAAAGDPAADASLHAPAEVVEAPGAIDETPEGRSSSSVVSPLPQVPVEPAAAEKGRTERARSGRGSKAPADRAEHSLAGSVQQSVEQTSEPKADQGAEQPADQGAAPGIERRLVGHGVVEGAEQGSDKRAEGAWQGAAAQGVVQGAEQGADKPAEQGAVGSAVQRGATQPRLIEPAQPVSTGSGAASVGTGESRERTAGGTRNDPFPDDLTESGTPGSEGERRGRRDSWTDAFRRPEEDD